MKNLKQTKEIILILVIAFIYSCSKDEQISPVKKDIQQSKNFVKLEDAYGIASVIEYPLSQNPKKSLRANKVTSTFKEIETALVVPDKDGTPSFYIINYKDNGFIMISADKRTNPIKAYSLTEKFPIQADKLPNGLLRWMAETSEMITQIRVLNKKQTESVARSWDICNIQGVLKPEDHQEECGRNCKNTYKTVGPLLETNWHQREGFNNHMPQINCNNLPNNRAYAGCVPIAMAQIMKYHKYPKRYKWNLMPNDNGSNITSLLIKDIHSKIKNMYGGYNSPLNYKCDGTGVKSGANMSVVLKRNFGFSSANRADYNHNIVVNELNYGRPVILSGSYKTSGWWIFSSYSGHMWVCDGYRDSTIYSEDCKRRWGYLYLHMNWGWGKNGNNGWFAFNNWNPGSRTYNNRRKMIFNIKP